MLLEISGEITPERMKGWSQSKKTMKSYRHPKTKEVKVSSPNG